MQRPPLGHAPPPPHGSSHPGLQPAASSGTARGVILLAAGGIFVLVVCGAALLCVAASVAPASSSRSTAADRSAVQGDASIAPPAAADCRKRGPDYEEVSRLDPARGELVPECRRIPQVREDGSVSKVVWEAYDGSGSWPVSVDEGKLVCASPGLVFFDSSSARYAVNGAAAAACVGKKAAPPEVCGERPVQDVEAIWLDDPNPQKGLKKGDVKVSIDRFIQPGLKLCRD